MFWPPVIVPLLLQMTKCPSVAVPTKPPTEELILPVISERGDYFSVSVIIPVGRNKNYFKMISYKDTGKQANIPKIFQKSIHRNDAGKYYFGKIFEDSSRDIRYLMTKEDIIKNFYFDSHLDHNTEKYSQYIGIPICCSKGQKIALLGIMAHDNSMISTDKNNIKKITEEHLILYSNFILLGNKLETAIIYVPRIKNKLK